MLKKYVLPWFANKNITVEQLLTDRGAEFYGKSHGGEKFQAVLQSLNIEHIKMRAYNSPEVNGICARFHTQQKSAFYDTLLRTTSFDNLAELEGALQRWLIQYNEETPHQERYCFGKTPISTLNDSMHLINELTE